MKRIFVASWCFILLLVPFVAAAEKVVFVTVEKDIPPNIYRENSQIQGIYAGIIREVCKHLDIEAEFRQYPWKRCVKYVREGKADAIFPPIITKERSEFLYFPDEAIMMKRVGLFALKDRGIRVETLDDLRDKVVGVNMGYSYGPAFDSCQGLEKDYSRNIKMQVQKLLHKRMDVAAAVEAPFMLISNQLGAGDTIERVYVISEVASYVAFSKAIGPKGKMLAEKFSRVLYQLKKDGVIRKIKEKYIKNNI